MSDSNFSGEPFCEGASLSGEPKAILACAVNDVAALYWHRRIAAAQKSLGALIEQWLPRSPVLARLWPDSLALVFFTSHLRLCNLPLNTSSHNMMDSKFDRQGI